MRHARVTRFKLRALNQVTLDDAGINVAEKAAETLGHVSNGEAFAILCSSPVTYTETQHVTGSRAPQVAQSIVACNAALPRRFPLKCVAFPPCMTAGPLAASCPLEMEPAATDCTGSADVETSHWRTAAAAESGRIGCGTTCSAM